MPVANYGVLVCNSSVVAIFRVPTGNGNWTNNWWNDIRET